MFDNYKPLKIVLITITITNIEHARLLTPQRIDEYYMKNSKKNQRSLIFCQLCANFVAGVAIKVVSSKNSPKVDVPRNTNSLTETNRQRRVSKK